MWIPFPESAIGSARMNVCTSKAETRGLEKVQSVGLQVCGEERGRAHGAIAAQPPTR